MAQKDNNIRVPGLAGGLNSGAPRNRLALNQCPAMLNFTVVDGVARKRTGYAANAYTTTDWSGGKMYAGHHYQDGVTGTKRFWALGDTKIMEKSTIDGQWVQVTGLTPNATANWYYNTTEIVSLDDYKNYLIVCQADTKRLTGVTPGNWQKIYYANSPTGNLTLLAGANLGYHADDTNHWCKRVVNFMNRLVLLHTLEEYSAGNYAELFQRVRWSDLGHFTTNAHWDSTSYSDLRSGFGAIMNGEVLNNTLVIYQENAISAGYDTGSSTAPFHFETKLPGIGLYAARLRTSNGEAEFFVGSDGNIYQYFGGKDRINIGRAVRTEFFNAINKTQSGGYAYADRSWAFCLEDIEAVIFAIPTGAGDTDPTMFYVYFWNEQRWDKWDYADTITGLAAFEQPASTNVAKLPLFTNASGAMRQLDYVTTNDVSTAIDSWINTEDFVLDLQHDFRFLDLWFEASGDGSASSVDVSISVDSGTTFTNGVGGADATAQTVTVGTTWNIYHVRFAVTGYVVRFKYRNNTASQKLLLGEMNFNLSEMNQR